MAIAEEGGLKPKLLTGQKQDWLDQYHKTEEYHLNIEKLTALICYTAHLLFTIYGNMRCETNKLKILNMWVNIKIIIMKRFMETT